MDWITDRIAIGNVADAGAVGPDDVDAILCLKPNCTCEDHDELDTLAVPLVDGAGNPADKILRALDYLASIVDDDDRILVHCHAGRSRSVAIVAAFLMRRSGLSRAAALSYISERRAIYLSPGIDEILDLATEWSPTPT